MNERITRLKKGIEVEKYPLCIEKARLLTESYRKTEGEPTILRRAKALDHVLRNVTVFIEDDELHFQLKLRWLKMFFKYVTMPAHTFHSESKCIAISTV